MEPTPPPGEPIATDPDSGARPHGRVGYGFYGRWTPVALAAVLIGTLLAIGAYDRRRDPKPPAPARQQLIGTQAPPTTLTLLDGGSLDLASLRGEFVILNFWASWCAPCRSEAPVLQEIAATGEVGGRPVRVVGVGLKADNTDDARAFVKEFGLSYPIGRDTSDEPGLYGPIQQAYHLPDAYPVTVFIDETGQITGIHTGELTREIIASYADQSPTA